MRKYFTLFKETYSEFSEDKAQRLAAALAYYTLFSIAPLLVIVIAVAGLLFGAEAARGQIINQLAALIGPEGAATVQTLLLGASDPARSTGAAIVGTVTFLLGASTVFGELQGDLNRIWREPQLPKVKGLVPLIRERILSFGMVLGIGFLLIVSLLISAALQALGNWWGSHLALWPVVLEGLNSTVTFATITLAFAMIYRFLPRSRIGWHDVWLGATFTALLFTIGKLLIGIYLGNASIGSAYGAAGSLVVLLVWVYYSAQIFLLGAEFTWVFAYRFGSKAGQLPPPQPPSNTGAKKPRRAHALAR